MKKIRPLLGIIAITILELTSFFYPSPSYSANLTQAKDTLQSSRMSFNGRVKSPTILGNSHVWIYTAVSGNATSISTAGLKPGDSLVIGGTNSYTILNIVDADEFTVTPVLASGDADDGDVIYFKAKPQHIITFKTASAVNAGYFQVLIPAAAATSNDGAPDPTGFDFNTAVTATATSVTNYTFSTGVATAAGVGNCITPANYHCVEFHYIGTGAIGTDLQLFIGLADGTNTMIAPAPGSSRTADQADTYSILVKNFTNTSDPATATPTDDVVGKIAVIESVRVTVTVDPTITFKIEGNTAGSHCSLTTDVASTATSVPFGSLVLDTFKSASQKLTVSTNAVSGYAVTAIENERLSNLATSPSYIADTVCDSACTNTGAGTAWATATNYGFGYTMAVVSSTPTVAPIAPLYRSFSSNAANEPPVTVMSNTTYASSQVADVCYKISVGASQPAGDYENQITYTATATY